MAWMLQAATVVAVPLSILGLGWAGVRAYRASKAHRSASAEIATHLYLNNLPGSSGLKSGLADLVDGKEGDGGALDSAGWLGDD